MKQQSDTEADRHIEPTKHFQMTHTIHPFYSSALLLFGHQGVLFPKILFLSRAWHVLELRTLLSEKEAYVPEATLNHQWMCPVWPCEEGESLHHAFFFFFNFISLKSLTQPLAAVQKEAVFPACSLCLRATKGQRGHVWTSVYDLIVWVLLPPPACDFTPSHLFLLWPSVDQAEMTCDFPSPPLSSFIS